MRLIAVTVAALTAAVLLAASSTASYTARHLSDGHVGNTKKELVAQRVYSATVIQNLSHSWRVAPRHRSCWAHVPWASVCDHARRRLIAHRWLYRLAGERLARIAQAEAAQARLRMEESSDVPTIIMAVFGPSYGPGALNVARCESGYRTSAVNGQYLGIFQMGTNERARYATMGYSTAYQQVVAAHNYFVAAHGWGPWECQP